MDATRIDRVEQDRDLESLARLQSGRFTRAQVRELCPDRPALCTNRIRSGHWRRLTSRVLALPGAPEGRLAALWTAHLHVGAGSVVSELGAAFVCRFPAVPPSAPAITVPDGSNRRAGGVVLRQRRLDPSDVTTVDGLPVTSVARTLVDVAGLVSRVRLESWLDHALEEKLTTVAEVQDALGRVDPRSRADLQPLVGLLADRLPGTGVEQSRLERELTAALRRAGLPLGVAQHAVPGRPGDRTGLVDRAWPEICWVVEVDGRRWHERRMAMRSDRARDRAAAGAGWLVSRFMWEDVVRDPDGAVADLRDIHAARCRDTAVRESG